MKRLRFILLSIIFFILGLTLILYFNEKIDGKALTEAHTNIMFTWFVVYSIAFMVIAYFFMNKKLPDKINPAIVLSVSLFLILVLKIYISFVTKGFTVDTGCFCGWSNSAGENLFDFYTKSWSDYPPLYIAILSFCGKLTSIFGIPQLIAIRIPSLLAEIGISLLIYRISTKNFTKTAGLFLAIAFALNPLVLFDNAIWGQMDVVLAFFIVLAIYLLQKNKFVFASILFASAILIKPQAIFFLPLLIFALIKNKKILPFIYSGLTGIATVFLIVLPFNKFQFQILTKGTESPIVKFEYATSKIIEIVNGALPFLKSFTAVAFNLPVFREFIWLGDLFLRTASGYPYISSNAANTYFLFNKNTTEDSLYAIKALGINFSTLGLIFVGLIIIFGGIVYLRGKHNSIPWFTGVFLNVGIFMLATRMHERYMFTVVALIIIAYIYSKDLFTPVLLLLFTLTNYINIDYVFTKFVMINYPWINGDSRVILFVSFLNVIGLAALTAFLMGLAFKNYLPINKVSIPKALTRTAIRAKNKRK